MHRGAGEQYRNRYATIGGVEMSLVAAPTVLVALGIARRAAITRRRDLIEHLRQNLPALAAGSGTLLVAAKNRGNLAREDGGEWWTVEVDKKGAD